MAKRKDVPNRVYWHRNQWQYKARADERLILGKAWWPLGGTQDNLLPAHQAFAALQERLGQAGGMDKLFSKWEREILLHPSNPLDYSDRTKADKIKHLKILRTAFGHMSPSSIRPKHCAQYLDLRGAKSRSQANQEFNTLSVVFKSAVRWGVVDINPCKGLSRHKIQDRDRLPTRAELEALKSVSTPFIRLYVDLKYKTGLRQKDLLELRVRNCDFKAAGIPITTSKTGKKGYIPWDDELRDVIRGLMRLNKVQGETVICTDRGKALSGDAFSARWGRCMDAALSSGVLSERFREHDIRATHATAAEDDHGLNATDQLLHDNPNQKKAYLRSKKATTITPLPLKKKGGLDHEAG